MTRIVSITICLLFFNCNNPKDKNFRFIDRYGNENFSVFKSTSFFIRSGDNEGGIMIFAYDNKISMNKDIGAYIIDFDLKSKKIKSTSSKLIANGIDLDKNKLEKLAFIFAKYPICLLDVDSNNNVLISLKMNARPDLIRFSDLKFKTSKYEEWTHIKGSWYQKE